MSPARVLLCWRLAAWTLATAPLLQLGWLILQGRLGANPVEFIEHHSGQWALRLLLLTLAMSPLRERLKRSEPLRIRRLLGLWAFAWACLHFSIYLTFDLEFSARQLAADLIKRRYITLGFAALLLLLPLALTSTRGWQQRLKRRWATLHKLIYPAALLAALHFVWLVKSDLREPLLYLALLLGLLLWRRPWRVILRARKQPVIST
ncbi:sulfoxide reductase heme-binding subunit YedZ [Solimonas aquatica]|uniref:Protein-methionine-sulfoxide reductase heme-binding subunit MsrQ n=1 Tax=Solimonas aquatica TaxID=489703 RepID=A0A1H9J6D0_9GAMM|nr:protein-methionine-sulfoxide reductase heme-binding subunit MsrQ [Solimonas aquatica]SEQ82317.1 sulfoxide reductase heme-binding subunit YedZ [Solimonas aquatica]